MLTQITYYPILGKPLMMYLGILVFLSFTATAIIGRRVFLGKTNVRYHLMMVRISFTLAIIHAILGILIYF